MKKSMFLLFSLICFYSAYSQQFSSNKVSLANFITRMYNSKPFEGVKVMQDYDNNYLVSVVILTLDSSKSESVLNRIASIKAKSNANLFISGSAITSESIIKTTDEKIKDTVKTKTEVTEIIKETANGFVQGMELLTSFDTDTKQRVFVFIRELTK